MFPQGGAVKEPQDHVVIRVVPGVLGGYIVEHTEI